MAVSQRAPLRKIVDLPAFRYGALLECGHIANDVRHGQYRSRCQDCLRRLPFAIKKQRTQLMLRTQRGIRKKPWDKIDKYFSMSTPGGWLTIANIKSMIDIVIIGGQEELLLYTSEGITF